MKKLFKIKWQSTLLVLTISLLIISCIKENNAHKKECDKEGGKKYSIFSHYLGTDYTVIQYISLQNKKVVTAKEDWDISISGNHFSQLNANTTKGAKLNYIDLNYTTVDANKILETFDADKTNFKDKFIDIKNFGLNNNSLDNNKPGWLNYTYAPNHLVIPVKDRTLLVITPQKLYKIKMISMYECGVENPTAADAFNIVYLTCNFEEVKTKGLIDL